MKSLHKKPLLILLVMICTAAVMLTGCGQQDTQSTTEPSQEIWGTPPEETLGLEVKTDYISLYYPRAWEGEVTPVQTEVDGNQVLTFQANLYDQEIDLFFIILGPNEAEGYLLGQLKGDGQDPINVYSVVNEQNPEDWSEEQYNEICALQERINEITVLLYEDPRFVPNHPKT